MRSGVQGHNSRERSRNNQREYEKLDVLFIPVLNYAPRHEDVLGERPPITNLCARWRWVASFRFTPGV